MNQENYKYNNDNQYNDDFSFSSAFNFLFLASILKRRFRIFITVSAIIFISILSYTVYKRLSAPIYRGFFSLLVTDPFESDRNSRGNPADLFDQLTFNNGSNDLPTLVEFLKSPTTIKPIAEKYGISPYKLSNSLIIKPRLNEEKIFRSPPGLLNIFLNFKDPVQGEILLKDLSTFYINLALEVRQKRLSEGLIFLNDQAPDLISKTKALQEELSKFREKHNLINPIKEAALLKEAINTLESEIFNLDVERKKLLQIRNSVEKGDITTKGFITSINNNFSKSSQSNGLSIEDPNISFLQELKQLEDEYSRALTLFLPSSERIKNIQKRIDFLKPMVQESQLKAVETALRINSSLKNSTNLKKDELLKSFNEKPDLIAQYQTISQELEIVQGNLKGLVSSREKFQLAIAQKDSSWKITLEPTFGQSPISPSFKKNVFYGIILSFSSGLLLVLIRDKFDEVYHDTDEVKQKIKETHLTHIPNVSVFLNQEFKNQTLSEILENFKIGKLKSENKESFYENFIYQEALRNLYTSIKFLGTNESIKIFSISSSIPQEGKSLINLLLSQTIADIGKKVLLIDCDMRKPQIHKRLGINNIYGLSNYLSDTKLELKDVAQNMSKNFTVIPAGQIPPDPTKLLDSERMKSFVQKLRDSSEFDYIVMDNPPILGLSDSMLINKITDGLILIVSLNKVKRALPLKSLENIRNNKINLLGLVTNSVKKDTSLSLGQYQYGGYYKAADTYGTYAEYIKPYFNSDEETEKEDKKELITKSTFRIRILEKIKLLLNWLDNNNG